MNLGIWQFLLILFIFVLLFGNFPKILKDIAEGIKAFKEVFKRKE